MPMAASSSADASEDQHQHHIEILARGGCGFDFIHGADIDHGKSAAGLDQLRAARRS